MAFASLSLRMFSLLGFVCNTENLDSVGCGDILGLGIIIGVIGQHASVFIVDAMDAEQGDFNWVFRTQGGE